MLHWISTGTVIDDLEAYLDKRFASFSEATECITSKCSIAVRAFRDWIVPIMCQVGGGLVRFVDDASILGNASSTLFSPKWHCPRLYRVFMCSNGCFFVTTTRVICFELVPEDCAASSIDSSKFEKFLSID